MPMNEARILALSLTGTCRIIVNGRPSFMGMNVREIINKNIYLIPIITTQVIPCLIKENLSPYTQ